MANISIIKRDHVKVRKVLLLNTAEASRQLCIKSHSCHCVLSCGWVTNSMMFYTSSYSHHNYVEQCTLCELYLTFMMFSELSLLSSSGDWLLFYNHLLLFLFSILVPLGVFLITTR